MSPDSLLDELDQVLAQIASLIPADKKAWDTDRVLQLAVERLWIAAGSLAERYRVATDLPPGALPWAEFYIYRSKLAHARPSEIASDRVYAESVSDLARPREAVERLELLP